MKVSARWSYQGPKTTTSGKLLPGGSSSEVGAGYSRCEENRWGWHLGLLAAGAEAERDIEGEKAVWREVPAEALEVWEGSWAPQAQENKNLPEQNMLEQAICWIEEEHSRCHGLAQHLLSLSIDAVLAQESQVRASKAEERPPRVERSWVHRRSCESDARAGWCAEQQASRKPQGEKSKGTDVVICRTSESPGWRNQIEAQASQGTESLHAAPKRRGFADADLVRWELRQRLRWAKMKYVWLI